MRCHENYSEKTLREFWESSSKYEDAKGPLEAWHDEVKSVDWATPKDVKAQFGTASILKGSRVIFNIHGNKYRLVVKINYAYKIVYIRFVGTHKQYDATDVESI